TPAPAVVEMKSTLPVYVLQDVTPLLVGINADVRPTIATVDGVIGTALLQRLVSTIDYPGGRFLASCVREDECIAYPRVSIPNNASEPFCMKPSDLGRLCQTQPGLRACPPAP